MVKAVIGVMGFGDEGIISKRISAATRSWKSQVNIVPWELPEETSMVNSLILAQWYLSQISDFQNCLNLYIYGALLQ